MEHWSMGGKSNQLSFEHILSAAPGETMPRLYDREKIPEQWNEFFEFCQSDSLSEEGLRQIIERRGLTTHNLPSFHFGSYQFFREVCRNERVDERIIRCLLEYFPAAASAIEDSGWSPLHSCFRNPNVTLKIIQLLIDAAPDSIRSETSNGRMPLHHFCREGALDGAAAIQMLKLLIEKYPAAVRHADTSGDLPIHIASQNKSPEFCRVLIDGYPGSERMNNVDGVLPLHYACLFNTVAAVEYLYKLYPDAIYHAATNGRYPIHYAIGTMSHRDNPIAAVEIAKYLLECDTNVKFQKIRGRTESLLHVACHVDYTDSNIHAGIQIIKAIYDAYPEAIEENSIVSDIQRCHERVETFINNELVYARQAKDHHQMTTSDSNERLPLHTALQNNVTLGSIKLLVKGHPPAVQSPDNSGLIPLHIACQHHESANVIQYLVGLDTSTLDAVDEDRNTALHLACPSGSYEIIALLLDKFDAVSVSKQNAQKKLPIDLLWESSDVLDRGSIEYTESVFRLLRAYPESLMNIDMQMQSCPRQSGKKRKFGKEE